MVLVTLFARFASGSCDTLATCDMRIRTDLDLRDVSLLVMLTACQGSVLSHVGGRSVGIYSK